MTDQPITEQQLADIEARAAAATEGPWFVHADWPGRVFAESEFNAHIARVTGSNSEPNEQFIAHARADVPLLLAEVRRRSAVVALPARWECGHGVSDDEPFCAEVEDEGHVCPTIRVHPDDAVQFAGLVDEIHRLRKSRDAFRDQRNAVFTTNQRLIGEVHEADQARLRAENETRTARRELEQRAVSAAGGAGE